MNQQDLKQYCKDNGIPCGAVGPFRVMDLTQLPEHMRENFDERGLFVASAKSSSEIEIENVAEVSEVELTGKLPEDFPGHAALMAEGFTTYAKVRKRLSDLTDIPGIGDATAEKIQAAMSESPKEEESE